MAKRVKFQMAKVGPPTCPSESAPKTEGPDHTALILKAVQALGHERINGDSLTALRESIDDWGMKGTAAKVGIPVDEFRAAYTAWMDMLREMFGPVGSDE